MSNTKNHTSENHSQNKSQQIDAYELCTTKCLQTLSTNLTLPEKSCFNRCIIKYTEALKFVVDNIKHQNYEKKDNKQYDNSVGLTDNRDLAEKFKHIYEQHFGTTYNNNTTTF